MAVAAAAILEGGPILECGCGLTTIVLANIARRTGSSIFSLEHDPSSRNETLSALGRFGLRPQADVRLSPMRDYGGYDWYDVDPSTVPEFSLVVCDGPDTVRGARYGLLPVLGPRLNAGCTILLDDAERKGEQELLRRWEAEGRVRFEMHGRDTPYAVAVTASPTQTRRRPRDSTSTVPPLGPTPPCRQSCVFV